MVDFIYVHIDNISNAVLTQGFSATDFHQGIVHHPQNLLLLDPSSELGEYEAHTAMKTIRGSEAVKNYFQTADKKRVTGTNKWIDFTDIMMLKELTPTEISELLYFGHMKSHLHSPFFYKLQNNFAYFDLQEELSRVYYRYLDEFYQVLSKKLTHLVSEVLNSRRSLFQKNKAIEPLPLQIVKTLSDIMKEGLVFSFKQTEIQNKKYQIPLFLVEDTHIRMGNPTFKNDALIGYLTYYTSKNMWDLDINKEDLDLWTLPNTTH
ncbi:hypothetical protein LQF61_04835 [Tetragenococcus koreensis]|uniref:Uncharacterized protein n=1 Tax=Tetragenococcus koreensis TaxID=290335 RepID=A0AAN4RIQ5_9ENTE|nr:hypothetical protein [Tetragenococcus koreensis]AYW46275.1 hypothetical protein C7K43_10240 [Tetragenococcus koreensis]MCF1585021.1 hypothetical protein [Tetragenococcus koreensis]MCF1614584.1 hypothetical protein [Tetragenococcus koreensis]MCF1617139.1 hypothetical protein [Tetragenococcus koreensis]MCF1619408.1 hypothetical protein [Tetragenococcus koreensis]